MTIIRLAIAAFAFALSCARAAESPQAPASLQGSIVEAKGVEPLSISESQLRVWFPQLAGSAAVAQSCYDASDEQISARAVFAPIVIGDHAVQTSRVDCTGSAEGTRCELQLAREYFDKDPSQPFALGEGVSLEEGLEVVRVFASAAFEYEDSVRAPKDPNADRALARWRVARVRRAGPGYSLSLLGDPLCGGCSGVLYVVPVVERGRLVKLRLPGGPGMGCVVESPAWLK